MNGLSLITINQLKNFENEIIKEKLKLVFDEPKTKQNDRKINLLDKQLAKIHILLAVKRA